MKAIVPPTNVTVLEPHEQKLMQFSAISVNTLFDHLFGKSWQKHEEVLFTSVIAMSVSIFLSVIQAKPDEIVKEKDDDTNQTLKAILDQVTQLNNYIHQRDYDRFTKLNADGEQLISNNLQHTTIGVYPLLRNLKF